MPKARKAKKYFEPKKKIGENVAPQAVSVPGQTPAPTRAAASRVRPIAERYPYVTTELKRIAILTGIILVILVVLWQALP